MFQLARKTIANQVTISGLRLDLSRKASSIPVAGSAGALAQWTSNKKIQDWVNKHSKL
jgi:hypothetical protein